MRRKILFLILALAAVGAELGMLAPPRAEAACRKICCPDAPSRCSTCCIPRCDMNCP